MPLAKGHDTSRGTDYGVMVGSAPSLTWQTWKTLPFSRHETRDWFERFFFVARFKTVLRVQILQRGHEKFQILQDMFVFQAGGEYTYLQNSLSKNHENLSKTMSLNIHWTPPNWRSAFFPPSITFEITTKKKISLGQWIGLLPGLLSWSSFELIPHLSDLFHFRLQTSQLFYSSASVMQTSDEIHKNPSPQNHQIISNHHVLCI